MDKNFKVKQLRAMNDDELDKQLRKFREELFSLNTSRVIGNSNATKLGRIKVSL